MRIQGNQTILAAELVRNGRGLGGHSLQLAWVAASVQQGAHPGRPDHEIIAGNEDGNRQGQDNWYFSQRRDRQWQQGKLEPHNNKQVHDIQPIGGIGHIAHEPPRFAEVFQEEPDPGESPQPAQERIPHSTEEQ